VLGFNIAVFRLADGGAKPAAANSACGTRLAIWQTGWQGLAWLNELVSEELAIALGGNGYPTCYTAQAARLVGPLTNGPPDAKNVWMAGPTDVLTDAWEGKTVIDHVAIEACDPDEWLLVEAWDES
jgi:hypothetical protein